MRWKCVGHLLGQQICNLFNLNSINNGGEVSDRLLPEHFNDIEVLLKLR